MRKLFAFAVLLLLLWLAFDVGREVGRQEVDNQGSTPSGGREFADTAVQDVWRRPVGRAGVSQPATAVDTTPPTTVPAKPVDTGLPTKDLATPTEEIGNEACGSRCGVQRWQVKTLSDADRDAVLLTPVDATIEQLGSIPRPNNIPSDGRVRPYETTIYRVRGFLAAVSDQADGDLHLVVFDTLNQRVSLIAEIPNPECSGACRSGFAGRFATARQTLAGGLDSLASAGSDDRILLEVIGVGFFDHAHGQTGAAPNLFELHPVLAIRFVR